jgi:hypothetical protein
LYLEHSGSRYNDREANEQSEYTGTIQSTRITQRWSRGFEYASRWSKIPKKEISTDAAVHSPPASHAARAAESPLWVIATFAVAHAMAAIAEVATAP